MMILKNIQLPGYTRFNNNNCRNAAYKQLQDKDNELSDTMELASGKLEITITGIDDTSNSDALPLTAGLSKTRPLPLIRIKYYNRIL